MRKRFSDYSTISLENDPRVREYFNPNSEAYGFRSKLLKNNIVLYTQIFGKPQFHHRGEFYTSIWLIPFKGHNYFLCTSKKGSSYETEWFSHYEPGQYIRLTNRPNTEFLEMLMKKILTNIEYALYIF